MSPGSAGRGHRGGQRGPSSSSSYQAQGQPCWGEAPDPTPLDTPEGYVWQEQGRAERAGSVGWDGLQGEPRANIAGVKVGGVSHRAGRPGRASAVAVLMPGMHLPGPSGKCFGPLRGQNGAGAQAEAPQGTLRYLTYPRAGHTPTPSPKGTPAKLAKQSPREGREENNIDLGTDRAMSKERWAGSCSLSGSVGWPCTRPPRRAHSSCRAWAQ